MRGTIALVLLVFAGVTAIAQDEPAPLPARTDTERPRADASLAEQDRDFLARAARRQGGASLSEGATSLRIEFGRVRGRGAPREDDGVSVTPTFDAPKAWFGWRRNPEHAPSFIEHRETNGEAITRGLHPPRRVAWLRRGDGQRPTVLTEQSHAEDLRELRERRRFIATLAEMLVLRRLLSDAGAWLRVHDDTHAGRAFFRRPAEDSEDGLPFVLWFDEKTLDPAVLRLPAAAKGEEPRDFKLAYHERLPYVTGAELRVPLRITAFEDAKGRETAPKETPRLELSLLRISFEPLPDSTFAARVRRKAAPERR